MLPLDARGTKQTCTSCGTRFYDLGRAEIACPGCAVLFVPPPIEVAAPYDVRPTRKSWSNTRPAPRPVVAAVEPDDAAEEASETEDAESAEDTETEKAGGFGDELLLEADLTETDDDVPVVPRDKDAG